MIMPRKAPRVPTGSAAAPDGDCAIYHADSTVSSVLTKDVADNLRRGRIRKTVLGCVTPRTKMKSKECYP